MAGVIALLSIACIVLAVCVVILALSLRMSNALLELAVKKRDEAIRISSERLDELLTAEAKTRALERQIAQHRVSWGYIRETLQAVESNEPATVQES